MANYPCLKLHTLAVLVELKVFYSMYFGGDDAATTPKAVEAYP